MDIKCEKCMTDPRETELDFCWIVDGDVNRIGKSPALRVNQLGSVLCIQLLIQTNLRVLFLGRVSKQRVPTLRAHSRNVFVIAKVIDDKVSQCRSSFLHAILQTAFSPTTFAIAKMWAYTLLQTLVRSPTRPFHIHFD
jgi:hypothetical protein